MKRRKISRAFNWVSDRVEDVLAFLVEPMSLIKERRKDRRNGF